MHKPSHNPWCAWCAWCGRESSALWRMECWVGAGDQESDSRIRSSCLHYLCAPALLQLSPRKSQLLCAKMTDEKRPHLPLPHTNGLKQFAVCHQLMRRENCLETLNDNIIANFIKSEFWGDKSRMQSSLVCLLLSWKCHVLVQQKLSLWVFYFISRTDKKYFSSALDVTGILFQIVLTRTTRTPFFCCLICLILSSVSLFSAFCSAPDLQCCQICVCLQNIPVWWRLSYIIFMLKLIQFAQNSGCGNKHPFV